MLKQLLAVSLVLATLSSPAAAVWVWVPTKAECVVADPTGTPLNVRSTPNGAILGALHNDTKVIVAETIMASGQKWARVMPEIGKQGWVFRNYLNCD
jgi:hypothetical protein